MSTNNFVDRIRPYFPEDSYRKVAKRAGINPETVRLWLTGKYMPSNKNVERLAAMTGKSPTWILTGNEDSPDRPEGLPDFMKATFDLHVTVIKLQDRVAELTKDVATLKKAQDDNIKENRSMTNEIKEIALQAIQIQLEKNKPSQKVNHKQAVSK